MASTPRGASQTRGVANVGIAKAGANGDVYPNGAVGVYFDAISILHSSAMRGKTITVQWSKDQLLEN